MATQSIRWWALEGKQALEGVWATVRELQTNSESRLDAYARYLEAYDVELPTNGRRGSPYRRVDEEVLTPNKYRRVLDTIQAKIIRNKILPQAVSTGGDYSTRARAKGFSLFLEGLLATERMDEIADLGVRDALLCGFAAVKVTPDAGRVNFATLCRFANSGGSWIPKDPDIRATLGLPRIDRPPRVRKVVPLLGSPCWQCLAFKKIKPKKWNRK